MSLPMHHLLRSGSLGVGPSAGLPMPLPPTTADIFGTSLSVDTACAYGMPPSGGALGGGAYPATGFDSMEASGSTRHRILAGLDSQSPMPLARTAAVPVLAAAQQVPASGAPPVATPASTPSAASATSLMPSAAPACRLPYALPVPLPAGAHDGAFRP